MSTPTNSIGPVAPSGSSNPVSLRQWFINIVNWIKALSPSDATAYDTGWVAVPAAGTFTSTCEVRRIGRQLHFRGVFASSVNYTQSNAYSTLGVLPTDMRPSTQIFLAGVGWSGTAQFQAKILSTGEIQLRLFSGSVTIGTGPNFSIAGQTVLLD